MRIIIAVLSCCAIIACAKPNQVPGGVLPKEKMEAVLWDMIQADEFLKDFMLNRDTSLNDTLESIRMYERVFQYHKTDRASFDSSFNFYRTHPLLMKEILDSLSVKKLNTAPTELSPLSPLDSAITIPVDTSKFFPRIKKAMRPN